MHHDLHLGDGRDPTLRPQVVGRAAHSLLILVPDAARFGPGQVQFATHLVGLVPSVLQAVPVFAWFALEDRYACSAR